ncbi:MAG: protein-glutamate O-methyltransferase CheR [Bacillota bacterium]|nr:protein-glutamate O-methyltransferase CheR [Bacillota bacterium]
MTEKEFIQLTEYIESNYGIHLKKEKKTLVMGRLHNILVENKCSTFSDYFNLLKMDKTGNVVSAFINKITTNHTFFMREADHYDYFKNQVLPYLSSQTADKDLRIWSAGCSTGEEPYTLAMILDDYFDKQKIWWDTKVLATDISDRALDKAKSAIYTNEQIERLPYNWKIKHFKKTNSVNGITDQIRNEVLFRKFNLMDNFPFKRKFHVIFCRNVMIYFDNKTKIELINKFYEFTEPGGYLFIGHSESLNRDCSKYKYVLPAVYRKE